jgi:hypothetical protein
MDRTMSREYIQVWNMPSTCPEFVRYEFTTRNNKSASSKFKLMLKLPLDDVSGRNVHNDGRESNVTISY